MKYDEIRNYISEYLEKAKEILGASYVKAMLYGSYARGEANPGSDIDLIILSTLSDPEIETVERELYDLSFDFLMDYGIDISVIVENYEHFQHWLGVLPFYDNIQREGVMIGG